MRAKLWMFGIASMLGAAGCGPTAPATGDDMTVATALPDMTTKPQPLPDMVSVGPPGTPVLVAVSLVVHGTFKVSWQNPASGCTTITVNRKKDAGAYGVAQTVTGAATEVTDQPGHVSGNYCYTITCTLNGMDSAASNEKCAMQ